MAMGGALLAELILRERAEIKTERKRHWVVVTNRRPTGDKLLDECVRRIATSKRRGQAQSWVSRFAYIKNLKHRVAEQLCRRGILKAETASVLWVFSRRVYPELDPRPERELLRRLKRAIFSNTSAVDTRTVILISLAHRADLLRLVFPRKDLKQRKGRIESLISGELAGKATGQAVQAAQAAAVTAALVPVMVTAVHSH